MVETKSQQISCFAIDSLKEKKFFKLVCGASLNDLLLIENLSFLFTLAGADAIDLAARADVIFAARRGIKKAFDYFDGLKQEARNKKQEIVNFMPYASCLVPPLIMASIQLDQDPHFRKVQVDYSKCDLCGVCVKLCPTDAFAIKTTDNGQWTTKQQFVYKSERCFGCDVCPSSCHIKALSMIELTPSPLETLTEMIALGVDAIEFHFGENYEKVELLWTDNDIKGLVSKLKLLSFSIGSELLSEEEIRKAANLCFKLAGNGIILQCDGKPMSGGFEKSGNNMDNSTIRVAQIIQKENLPVYLQLSGGTTEKTYLKARGSGLDINGVAIGSYGRKLLMPYLSVNHIEDNIKDLESALTVAQGLVDSVKSFKI